MTSPNPGHPLRTRRRAAWGAALVAVLGISAGWANASPEQGGSLERAVVAPGRSAISTTGAESPAGAGGAADPGSATSGSAALDLLPLPPQLLPTTTTTTTTTTTPPSASPASPSEDQLVVLSKQCGCSAGVWAINATARTTSGAGRIWLTVNGRRAGEWALTTARRSVTALAFVPPGATVGVSSVAPPGGSIRSVLVDSFSVTDAPEGYTTVGRDMLDPVGAKYRMYGVVKSGFEYHEYGGEVGDYNAQGIESWGGTAVRLLASEHLLSPRSCWYSPGYLDRLAAEVATLNARGQFVMLNQWGSMGGSLCGVSKLREMPDDLAIDFWRDVATRFKGNPRVGFDLYNEPHDVTKKVWRDGGTVAGYHTPGMQALYDTVRATGATNLVFVSGPSWANDLRVTATMPLEGYGIVYAGHTYCFDCPDRHPRGLDEWMADATKTHPVVMAEFGDIENDQGEFNQHVIDWANAHDIGWLAYSWSHWEPNNPWALVAARSFKPTANGRPVYYALQHAAGAG